MKDTIQIRETGCQVNIALRADTLFDFDKFGIRPGAQVTLTQAAQLIRTQAKGAVRIDGHTDSKGTATYNQALSTRRAQSVQTWLIEREGLNNVAFAARGLGKTKPVAANTKPDGADDPEGRQKIGVSKSSSDAMHANNHGDSD